MPTDKDRIDWLAKNGSVITDLGFPGGPSDFQVVTLSSTGFGTTLREALDAAMEAED